MLPARVADRQSIRLRWQQSARLSSATAHHLIPRPGLTDGVASAIMFVVQNKFVTGTTVDVDGGWLHCLANDHLFVCRRGSNFRPTFAKTPLEAWRPKSAKRLRNACETVSVRAGLRIHVYDSHLASCP